MSRRSAQNPRYRKDAQVGSTRKSAASAKPKRDAGAAAKPAKSSGKKSSSAKGAMSSINPDTPEFRLWRRIWLGLLLVAMVLSGGSFALRASASDTIMKVVLTAAYACIFAAFFIDYTVIRRMRREWQEAKAGGKKKADKAESTEKTTEKATPAETAAETTAPSDEGKAD